MRTNLKIICLLTCFIAPGVLCTVCVDSLVVSGTIKPTYYGKYDPGWISVEPRDFEIAADGYIYQVGQNNDPRIENSTSFHLVKWSPTVDLLWNRSWDWSVRTRVYGMTLHNSFIYTAGSLETDTLVVKWSASGDVIWSRTWSWTSRQRALDVAVDQDGSVIVLCAVFDHNETASLLNLGLTVLLKYDSAGNFLANYSGGYCYGHEMDLKIADDDFIYTFDPLYGSISQWNSLGVMQWTIGGPIELFDVSSEGNFVVGTMYPPYTIRKLDSNQNEIWNSTDRVIWEEYFGGLSFCGSLDVSANETTFLLYKVRDDSNYSFVLDKFDSSGNLVWNKTIQYPETWDQEWGSEGVVWATDIAISSQGLIYINAYDFDGRLRMGVIVYGTPSQIDFPLNSIQLILGVCGLIGVIVILIILKRR